MTLQNMTFFSRSRRLSESDGSGENNCRQMQLLRRTLAPATLLHASMDYPVYASRWLYGNPSDVFPVSVRNKRNYSASYAEFNYALNNSAAVPYR